MKLVILLFYTDLKNYVMKLFLPNTYLLTCCGFCTWMYFSHEQISKAWPRDVLDMRTEVSLVASIIILTIQYEYMLLKGAV